MSLMSVVTERERRAAPAAPPAGVRRAWGWCCGAAGFLTQHGWIPLASLLVAGVAAFAFLTLADEVVEGETLSFDKVVFNAIAGRYVGLDPFWQEVGRDLTALGGTAVVTLMTAGVTPFLVFRRQWRSAAFVFVAVVGGLLINLGLKAWFNRDRPDLFAHGSHTMTASFPSGHSANAAVAYLAMAILLAKLVESVRMKAYVLGVGLLIPLLVGLSRVALAVHWPTDVVGGWLVGLTWGLLVYAAATYLQRRGKIEPEGELAAGAA